MVATPALSVTTSAVPAFNALVSAASKEMSNESLFVLITMIKSVAVVDEYDFRI